MIVMNPNYNRDDNNEPIKHNETMSDHAVHVWQNYVLNSGFDKLLIIAHSAGGGCLTSIMTKFKDTFYN